MAVGLAYGLSTTTKAVAMDWQGSISLDVAESYTDNVALAPEGSEEDEFVTEFSPRFSVQGTSPRLDVSADYRMQNLLFGADSSRNATFHQLDAGANAEVLEEHLFVDARAAAGQQAITPSEPIPQSNIIASGNRTDFVRGNVSPYWLQRFGSFAQGRLSYTHQRVQYSAGNVPDTRTNQYTVSLEDGPRYERFGWRLSHQMRSEDNEDRPDSEFEESSLRLSWRVGARTTVFATGGYEEQRFERAAGDPPEGSFWDAGFNWAPTTHTSIEAAGGERSFGKTGRLRATHQTDDANISIGYIEEFTTVQQLITDRDIFVLTDPLGNPIIDPATGDPVVVVAEFPALTTEVFLRRRADASFAYDTGKSTFRLSGFSSEREFQVREETERVHGGSAAWHWDMAVRTQSVLEARWSRREFRDATREDDIYNLTWRIERRIRRRVRGTLEYMYQERDSNVDTADYATNILSARINIRL